MNMERQNRDDAPRQETTTDFKLEMSALNLRMAGLLSEMQKLEAKDPVAFHAQVSEPHVERLFKILRAEHKVVVARHKDEPKARKRGKK